TKFALGAGAVLHVPRGICLATVFNWLRHRNEAPKSALHFGPGRYRLYWNRFHICSGSRYPTLPITQQKGHSIYTRPERMNIIWSVCVCVCVCVSVRDKVCARHSNCVSLCVRLSRA